jgi:hypothetical protein
MRNQSNKINNTPPLKTGYTTYILLLLLLRIYIYYLFIIILTYIYILFIYYYSYVYIYIIYLLLFLRILIIYYLIIVYKREKITNNFQTWGVPSVPGQLGNVQIPLNTLK